MTCLSRQAPTVAVRAAGGPRTQATWAWSPPPPPLSWAGAMCSTLRNRYVCELVYVRMCEYVCACVLRWCLRLSGCVLGGPYFPRYCVTLHWAHAMGSTWERCVYVCLCVCVHCSWALVQWFLMHFLHLISHLTHSSSRRKASLPLLSTMKWCIGLPTRYFLSNPQLYPIPRCKANSPILF